MPKEISCKTVNDIILDAKKRQAESKIEGDWDWWLLTSAYQAGVDAAKPKQRLKEQAA